MLGRGQELEGIWTLCIHPLTCPRMKPVLGGDPQVQEVSGGREEQTGPGQPVTCKTTAREQTQRQAELIFSLAWAPSRRKCL